MIEIAMRTQNMRSTHTDKLKKTFFSCHLCFCVGTWRTVDALGCV